jgi:predicted transposase YdaD
MPNDYDRILKENFEPLLPHLCRKLLGFSIDRMEPLDAKIQVTVVRELDNLKKITHDNPDLDYGLHWEIQSDDEDMRGRNLLYYALFYRATGLPLKQIVLYLGNAKPVHILKSMLKLEGLLLSFIVVNIKEIPKETFINSDVPEEVILALLCDFGKDRPEQVVRMILQHLLKLVGRVERLKKYQRQLQILSRLRKLQPIVIKEISHMPIKFDIQTDELYLEGIEKGIEQGIEKGIEQGIEKGIEQGIEKNRHEAVVTMLLDGILSVDKIASYQGVTVDYVLEVKRNLHI